MASRAAKLPHRMPGLLLIRLPMPAAELRVVPTLLPAEVTNRALPREPWQRVLRASRLRTGDSTAAVLPAAQSE
jgi:hypothetical protein